MTVRILQGDCRSVLASLPAESAHCCVTSPPYFGLRDYGVAGQIGLEPTPEAFVTELVEVFREVRRVLRSDGTLWLNLGDSYAGSWGAQSREHAGKHAPNISALSANQVKAAAIRQSGTGSISRAPGLKPKDLIGIPWRVAFALQADGWWLRSSIIWAKPNPMPESVTDRPTSARENIFLLAKSERYFYDHEAVKEPVSVPDWDNGTRVFGGKNKAGANARHGERTTGRLAVRADRKELASPTYERHRSAIPGGQSLQAEPNGLRNLRNVWTVSTKPFSEAHFATFPPALIEPCIKAGCPEGGTVLDPFGGAGTTGLVADRLGRDAILIELNPTYAEMARRRVERDAGMFAMVAAE